MTEATSQFWHVTYPVIGYHYKTGCQCYEGYVAYGEEDAHRTAAMCSRNNRHGTFITDRDGVLATYDGGKLVYQRPAPVTGDQP
jgi:hypothetical protein